MVGRQETETMARTRLVSKIIPQLAKPKPESVAKRCAQEFFKFLKREDKSQFVFRKYLFIYVATLIRTFNEDSMG